MIIKSMSRKEPTFGQLVSYMASEKSDGRYDIHHHCYARDEDGLAQEFADNAKLLPKRKNGNYLYHEIISFSVNPGVDRRALKEGLRDAALRYIEQRCPNNLVYGCLHEDHAEHLHYHLMFTANAKGEAKRLRITNAQLTSIKHEAEQFILTHHPEFQQKPVMTAKETKRQKSAEKFSKKAGEMKRRTGELPDRDEVRDVVKVAMIQSESMDQFCRFLSDRGYEFYVRGKNFGLKVEQANGTKKSHRFSTLGVHEEFEKFQSLLGAEKPAEAQGLNPAKSTPEPFEASERSSERQAKANKAQRDEDMTAQRKSGPADEKEKTKMHGEAREKMRQTDTVKPKATAKSRDTSSQNQAKVQHEKPNTTDTLKPNMEKPTPTPKDQEVDRLEREFQKMTNTKASSQKDGKKHSQ